MLPFYAAAGEDALPSGANGRKPPLNCLAVTHTPTSAKADDPAVPVALATTQDLPLPTSSGRRDYVSELADC
jgi:hypothetical protein